MLGGLLWPAGLWCVASEAGVEGRGAGGVLGAVGGGCHCDEDGGRIGDDEEEEGEEAEADGAGEAQEREPEAERKRLAGGL